MQRLRRVEAHLAAAGKNQLAKITRRTPQPTRGADGGLAESPLVSHQSSRDAAPLAGDVLADFDMASIVERYQRDGYVVVKGFLQGSLLHEHRSELDAYIADVIPTKNTDEHFFDGQWSTEGSRGPVAALKYINKMNERPFFAAFSAADSQARHPRWHAMAEALTSSEVLCNGCEWFNKPPRLSTTTPPHQDNFYFNLKPADEVVTLWVAMDEVNEDNGSLSYMPSSHQRGLRAHHASWIKGFSQSISDWKPEDAEAMVEVSDLRPGDLVAHHSECIHMARDNSSDGRTRVRYMCNSNKTGSEHPAVLRSMVDEEGYARYMTSAATQGSGGVA